MTSWAVLFSAAVLDANASPAYSCSNASFPHSLATVRVLDGHHVGTSDGSAARCLAACCDLPSCSAWQYHISSTDPTHHPNECWLSTGIPTVVVSSPSDVWEGGSKAIPMPQRGGIRYPPPSITARLNTPAREIEAQHRGLSK